MIPLTIWSLIVFIFFHSILDKKILIRLWNNTNELDLLVTLNF